MDDAAHTPGASVAMPFDSGRSAPLRRLPSLLAIRVYQKCEFLSEGLIYGAIVFSPWAFGTTQPWSIWVMNGAGYLLGALLLVKLLIRYRYGYRPSRWGEAGPDNGPEPAPKPLGISKFLVASLAILTIALLLFCLLSALNARSTYQPAQFGFDYHPYLRWLPHSLDSRSSWTAFWNYLALAGAFWAVCDWLPGKTFVEQRRQRIKPADRAFYPTFLLPGRLRRLLWVLCINGALLGIEGIVQRLSGTNRLLGFMPTRLNAAAEFQFGPYAYRANAAQYFNLLWPVCLGFWWTLWRGARLQRSDGNSRGSWPQFFLLLCVFLMALCPLISTSRGGTLVGLGQLIIATLVLVLGLRPQHGLTKLGLCLLVALILAAGVLLGWSRLGQRLHEAGLDVGDRERTYAVARPMAKDYPVFGTGPGTFNVLFQLYRPSLEEYWPGQLHNDWLETRITFGRVGSAMIGLAFLIVVARWLAPGGIHGHWRFGVLLWLGLAGCLAHARFDFPFQIYSILFLFLTLCAILFNLSRRPPAG